jgi:hypothetical protein
MKTYLTILLPFIFSTSFCQTRFDTVIFDNVNYSLLNELLLEKANDERKNISVTSYVEHEVCSLSAQYQCEYMTFYNRVCHENNFEFKNEKLVQIDDRVEYFSKRTKKNLVSDYEICLMREYSYFKKITYEKLSSELIGQFMSSEPHKKCLLLDTKLKHKICLSFSSKTRKSGERKIKFFVTGISGAVLSN